MATSLSTSGRQAFFIWFSQKALESLDSAGFKYPSRPAIVVTGGFRTPNLLYSALRSGHTDMLGIGRCSIVCPQIPNIMGDFEQRHGNSDGDIPFGATPNFSASDKYLKWWPIAALRNTFSKIQLMGAGINLAWYIYDYSSPACDSRAPTPRGPHRYLSIDTRTWLCNGWSLGTLSDVLLVTKYKLKASLLIASVGSTDFEVWLVFIFIGKI